MMQVKYKGGAARAADRMSRTGRDTKRTFGGYHKPDARYWNGNKDNGNIKVKTS